MKNLFTSLLLAVAFVTVSPPDAEAQRQKYIFKVDFPECNPANYNKFLKDISTLEEAQKRYPSAFSWWTGIEGQPAITLMDARIVSVCAAQALWSGNGSGWGRGAQCNSRNSYELPGGEYKVNIALRIFQGTLSGGGASIGAGRSAGAIDPQVWQHNATTSLVYDHDYWIDPAPIRAVILSTNWGTSTYLESCHINDIRINGKGPGWEDGTYQQHGIALRMFGETSRIGTVYVENCNNHGVWLNGAGPGKIDDLSAFDNNLCGLYVSNHKDGVSKGNSLGNLLVLRLSTDNNGTQYRNDYGGQWIVVDWKSETGLSNSRGKPYKASTVFEGHGWIVGTVIMLTDAVSGAAGPAFVLESTANKSRFHVLCYSQVADNVANVGRGILIGDVRAKKTFTMSSNIADLKFGGIEIDWRGSGTSSKCKIDDEPAKEGEWNSPTRLGPTTTHAALNYKAGTPVWNPRGQ